MSSGASAKVQASQPTYELYSLGWKAFQQLCVTIVGDVWGHQVQSFFDSRDGGRDGAFRGVVTSKSGEALSGSFAVQCKFSSRPAKVLKLSDLDEELTKARRLASKGLADNYFLFTNQRLTGSEDERLLEAFLAIPGIKHFSAYGEDRIALLIQESPRLRILVKLATNNASKLAGDNASTCPLQKELQAES